MPVRMMQLASLTVTLQCLAALPEAVARVPPSFAVAGGSVTAGSFAISAGIAAAAVTLPPIAVADSISASTTDAGASSSGEVMALQVPHIAVRDAQHVPEVPKAEISLHPLLPLPHAVEATRSGFITGHHFSSILAGITLAACVKAACMAGNMLVQVSPFPQVKRWESRGCTGEADAAPYVSIAFGGWQWCYYGTFAYLLTGRSGFLILVQSNCLGAILGSYYALTFFLNCNSQSCRAALNKYLSAVVGLALMQACALSVLPPERALFITGLVSSLCSFLGAMSILIPVPSVIKTQNSRSIPGPIVVANFFSALVWVVCGVMLGDPLVTGPNVMNTLASLVCIALKMRYPSDDDGPHADEEKGSLKGFTERLPRKHSPKITESTPLRKASFQDASIVKSADGDIGGTGGT